MEVQSSFDRGEGFLFRPRVGCTPGSERPKREGMYRTPLQEANAPGMCCMRVGVYVWSADQEVGGGFVFWFELQ